MTQIKPASTKQYWVKYRDPGEPEKTTTLWSIGPGEAFFFVHSQQEGRVITGGWGNGANYDDTAKLFKAPYQRTHNVVNPTVQEELF